MGSAEPGLLPDSYLAHSQLGTVSTWPGPRYIIYADLSITLNAFKKYQFLGPAMEELGRITESKDVS